MEMHLSTIDFLARWTVHNSSDSSDKNNIKENNKSSDKNDLEG